MFLDDSDDETVDRREGLLVCGFYNINGASDENGEDRLLNEIRNDRHTLNSHITYGEFKKMVRDCVMVSWGDYEGLDETKLKDLFNKLRSR